MSMTSSFLTCQQQQHFGISKQTDLMKHKVKKLFWDLLNPELTFLSGIEEKGEETKEVG